MRLPGSAHDCGPMWELGWVTRQLHLGTPVTEGDATIPVASIIGTVERGRDFDSHWHPLHQSLAKTLDDIEAASPTSLDEPIDVVRVDRAYFVLDGHKRVALAVRNGREFLDAQVRRIATPFEVTAELEQEAVLRTAREWEFRRHAGLAEALPDVRFPLTDVDGYGELFAAVQTHALEMAERAGHIVDRPQMARDWYERDYTPTVAAARQTVGGLIEDCTDADVFLGILRRRVAWWGSECDDADCAAHQLMLEQKLDVSRRRGSLVALLTGRSSPKGALVLPLAENHDAGGSGSTAS